MKTYAPGAGWLPAAYAASIIAAYYIVGPAVALAFHRVNQARCEALFRLGNAECLNTLAEFPIEGEAP